jgi:hypothetical protein
VEIAHGNVKRKFQILWHFVLFVLLTALTQVGGVVFLLALIISKRIKRKLKLKTLLVFIPIYLAFTFLIIPLIAPKFGRMKIQHGKPSNYMTIILNRNYVKPELNSILGKLEGLASYESTNIYYLDANFPFFDGFPLLPHLSHNDGKKLDLSLVYERADGTLSTKQKSRSGYGVFEGPQDGEIDQITKCKGAGYFQYDYPKYLTFGKINEDLQLSEKGTKLLVETILQIEKIEKVFIEPHLKVRLKLEHPKIRFHGCGAVRHDDHIHIQIK